jgi:hypothetical protein
MPPATVTRRSRVREQPSRQPRHRVHSQAYKHLARGNNRTRLPVSLASQMTLFAKSTKVAVAGPGLAIEQNEGAGSMNAKQILMALAVLSLMATAGAAQAGSQPTHDAAIRAVRCYQGEAPPWSFACIKDNGPTECREPMWICEN